MTSNVNTMELDASNDSNAPQQHDYPRRTDLPETDHITLDVDGHKYRTTKSILKNCDYFASLLSGRWPVDLLPDGSLPVDTDPEIWPALFAYIKRPTMYPLLWTREKGFDYVGYNKLLAEADFFGLPELQEWIKQKKFLEVIKTGYKMEIHPGQLNPISKSFDNHAWIHTSPRPEISNTIHETEVRRRLMIPPSRDPFPSNDFELVSCIEAKIPSQGDYKCPSRNPEHDLPEKCWDDMECELPTVMQGEEPVPVYEQLPTSIVTVVKYTEYRPERCMKDYVDTNEANTLDDA